jgi:hypothetical protein
MPPGRSGPKVLAVVAALLLIFLGVLWYASFAALHGRSPDRAFFTQDTWVNGTVTLFVSDIDNAGVVSLSTLTVNVTAQDRTSLFDGPLNRTVSHGNWTLTVTITDNDGSGTISPQDDLVLRADPPAAADYLIFTEVYLYSNGQQWSHFPLPAE